MRTKPVSVSAPGSLSCCIPLAFFSPRIQAAILDGRQPREPSVELILRIGIPLDWWPRKWTRPNPVLLCPI